MRTSRSLPFIFFGFVAVALFFPQGLMILAITAIILTTLHALAPFAFFKEKNVKYYQETGQEEPRPFVSIHIPICSEPPEMVCETILTAVKQDYPNFEVIVLDNNTTDPELWEPVEKYCNALPRVTFIHKEKLEGYKAGALNLCREISDSRTEYIFTVDADYQLVEGCLDEAVKLARQHEVALLQFPQAYWNVTEANLGLEEDYKHYFNIYSAGSNRHRAVLGTGTLSLISLRALDAIGGWPDSSITEDAELGTRLQLAGYKSIFINLEMGHGMMPLEMNGLRKQRLRWIFGNFQTLMNYFKNSKRITDLKRDSLLQLTAWINFLGIPALILLVSSVLHLTGIREASTQLTSLCLFTFVLSLVLKFLVFLKSTRYNPGRATSAFFTHLVFSSEAAFGWWDALFGLQKPFVRTSKFNDQNDWRAFPIAFPLLFLLTGLTLFSQSLYALTAVSLALSFTFSLANFLMLRQTGRAHEIILQTQKVTK